MNACRQESPVANSQSHVRCERANVITHENWQEYIKSFTGSRKSQVGDVTVGANQWDSDHTLMYLHFTFMMQSNSHSTVKSQERCLLNQGSKLSVYHYKGFNSFVTEESPPPLSRYNSRFGILTEDKRNPHNKIPNGAILRRKEIEGPSMRRKCLPLTTLTHW